MKTMFCWFFLSCKRYLRKISFLLILLALPAGTYMIRGLEEQEGQEVRIAVCAEGDEGGERANREEEKNLVPDRDIGTESSREEQQNDISERTAGTVTVQETAGRQIPLEIQLRDALVQEKNSSDRPLFRFYECQNEEQVKAEVASRRAECGYVISRGLRDKLDRKDYRRCIQVYSAPSTVLAALSTETVFAALASLYDRELFLNYVTTAQVTSVADSEVLTQLAGGLYDKWMGNGSTFRFEYRYRSTKGQVLEKESQSFPVFPVRGIVAVYLFIAGLYSAVMIGIDEKKGLFLPLNRSRQWLCRMAVLGAPVFLTSLSGLGALITGGSFQGIEREIVAMGIYCMGICVFSFVIKGICQKPQTVCCMIPLFLVGSLIFTPVFLDIRQFFPGWGWIEKLFLPSYYLRCF